MLLLLLHDTWFVLCSLNRYFYKRILILYPHLRSMWLESPCPFFIHGTFFRPNFVTVISALNGWIDFKIDVWLCILGILGDISFLFRWTCSFFITKISTPNMWIDFKFVVWLYIDGAYFVSNFDCFPISTSNGGIFLAVQRWNLFFSVDLFYTGTDFEV